jgi:hypothetical protein
MGNEEDVGRSGLDIQGTSHPSATSVQDVGINHRCFYVFVVKQDEIADVVNVGFLSFKAEVLETNRSPNLIKQAWRLRLRHIDAG